MADSENLSNITGITRVISKDQRKQTIEEYAPNARPGEIVVDLNVAETEIPGLYIGSMTGGNLELIAGGNGGTAGPGGGRNSFQINNGNGGFAGTGGMVYREMLPDPDMMLEGYSGIEIGDGNSFVSLQSTGTGNAYLQTSAIGGKSGNLYISTTGDLILPENNKIKIPGGDPGYYLQTDGFGNLTWAVGANFSGDGVPGGAATSVQYNDGSGNFAGSGAFTFDESTNTVTVTDFVVSGESTLGNVENVTIQGGTEGQALITDGNGNLSFSSFGIGNSVNGQFLFNQNGQIEGSDDIRIDEANTLLFLGTGTDPNAPTKNYMFFDEENIGILANTNLTIGSSSFESQIILDVDARITSDGNIELQSPKSNDTQISKIVVAEDSIVISHTANLGGTPTISEIVYRDAELDAYGTQIRIGNTTPPDPNTLPEYSTTDNLNLDAGNITITANSTTGGTVTITSSESNTQFGAASEVAISGGEGTGDFTDGGNVSVTGGDGTASEGGNVGRGGTLSLTSGNGGISSGDINITAGVAQGLDSQAGFAGNITLTAGRHETVAGDEGRGGEISILGGTGVEFNEGDTQGGNVTVVGGTGVGSGDGGVVAISGGQTNGTGSPGDININAGNGVGIGINGANVNINPGRGTLTGISGEVRITEANVEFTRADLGDVGNVIIDGGVNGYVLTTDGSGGLSWTVGANFSGNGVPGGALNQVQFNDGTGNFGADANFTFNANTQTLFVPEVRVADIILGEVEIFPNSNSFINYISTPNVDIGGARSILFTTGSSSDTSESSPGITILGASTEQNTGGEIVLVGGSSQLGSGGGILLAGGNGVGAGSEGGGITIDGGNINNSGFAGDVLITGGDGTVDDSNDFANVRPGTVRIQGGATAGAPLGTNPNNFPTGGEVSIEGGRTRGSGNGGTVRISAGDALLNGGDGGDVTIEGGFAANTQHRGGNINIQGGGYFSLGSTPVAGNVTIKGGVNQAGDYFGDIFLEARDISILSTTGKTTFGNAETLSIQGGADGFVLTTDGAGNLRWGVGGGGGGNAVSVPGVHFDVVADGANQTFENPIIREYRSSDEMVLYRNGVFVNPDNYSVSGNQLTVIIPLRNGDDLDIQTRQVSSANANAAIGTLQEVTDQGNVTTNSIEVGGSVILGNESALTNTGTGTLFITTPNTTGVDDNAEQIIVHGGNAAGANSEGGDIRLRAGAGTGPGGAGGGELTMRSGYAFGGAGDEMARGGRVTLEAPPAYDNEADFNPVVGSGGGMLVDSAGSLTLRSGGFDGDLTANVEEDTMQFISIGNLDIIVGDGNNANANINMDVQNSVIITAPTIRMDGGVEYLARSFADLPAANATAAGTRFFITDANLTPVGNYANVISGGGGNSTFVYSDGTNYRIG